MDYSYASPETNRAKGNFALTEFHNYSRSRYPSKYTATFEEMKAYLNKKTGTFTEWLGAEIIAREMSNSQVTESMQNLSNWWSGQFLANQESRWKAELDKVAKYSLFGAAKEWVSDAVDTVIETEKAGYGELKSGVETVVSDTAELAVDTTKTVLGGVGIYIVAAVVLIGGLVYVAGKSGAVKITKAV